LRTGDLVALEMCGVLELLDDTGGQGSVHVFHARTSRIRLNPNWEHDAYRWVHAAELNCVPQQVPWLRRVLDVAGVTHIGEAIDGDPRTDVSKRLAPAVAELGVGLRWRTSHRGAPATEPDRSSLK